MEAAALLYRVRTRVGLHELSVALGGRGADSLGQDRLEEEGRLEDAIEGLVHRGGEAQDADAFVGQVPADSRGQP